MDEVEDVEDGECSSDDGITGYNPIQRPTPVVQTKPTGLAKYMIPLKQEFFLCKLYIRDKY